MPVKRIILTDMLDPLEADVRAPLDPTFLEQLALLREPTTNDAIHHWLLEMLEDFINMTSFNTSPLGDDLRAACSAYNRLGKQWQTICTKSGNANELKVIAAGLKKLFMQSYKKLIDVVQRDKSSVELVRIQRELDLQESRQQEAKALSILDSPRSIHREKTAHKETRRLRRQRSASDIEAVEQRQYHHDRPLIIMEQLAILADSLMRIDNLEILNFVEFCWEIHQRLEESVASYLKCAPSDSDGTQTPLLIQYSEKRRNARKQLNHARASIINPHTVSDKHTEEKHSSSQRFFSPPLRQHSTVPDCNKLHPKPAVTTHSVPPGDNETRQPDPLQVTFI